MEPIIIKGRIEFCEEENKQYNRDFVATLQDSGAFHYGNHTAVTIEFGTMANGERAEGELLDTRYDTTIRKNESDFKKWVSNWFQENYYEHTLIIY